MMTHGSLSGYYAGPTAPPEGSEDVEFLCDTCTSRFRRREHLERHQRRHSQARPFQCPSCSKTFSRKDTLKRHVTTHGPNAVRSFERAARDNSKRVLEACDKCTTSKQRCDGHRPCDRCVRKGWGCHYPKGRSQSEAIRHQPLPQDNRASSPRQSLNQSGLAPVDNSPTQKDTSVLVMDNRLSSLFNGDPTNLFDPLPLFGFGDYLGDFQLDYTPDLLASGTNQGGYPTSTFYQSEPVEVTKPPTNTMDALGATSSQSMAGQVLSNSLHPIVNTNEDEMVISEDFCHVKPVSDDVYQAMLNFYYSNCQIPTATQIAIPRREVVNSLVQLYFEYFNPLVPIIHVPTFHLRPSNWVLLAAVAGIGCQYSAMGNRAQYGAFLHGLLDRFIMHIPTNRLIRGEEVYVAQAILLHNTWLLFHGTKGTLYRLQYQRNILITMCRPFLVGQGSVLTRTIKLGPNATEDDKWLYWVLVESWKRTIYFTWLLECYCWMFSDIPPILQHWELSLSMPCDSDLWETSNNIDWQQNRSHRQEQPSLVQLFHESDIPAIIKSLNEIGQFIAMISIHTVDRNLSFVQFPPFPHTRMSEPHNAPTLSNILDALFEQHTTTPQPPNTSSITLHQEKLAHLLSITRFTPSRTLYTAHGWRSTSQATEDAAKQLQGKMKDRETTRCRLLNAATLFRVIREQRIQTFCDPFTFVVATLFIHQVLQLIITKEAVPPSSTPWPPLRIDVPLQAEVRDTWIKTGDWNIHITGVGVLNRPDSATRLLKESARVLQGGTAWSRLSHGLAHSMVQFLNGQAPTLPSSP